MHKKLLNNVLYSYNVNLCSKLVDSLRGYAPSSECRQSIEPGVIPVSHMPPTDEFQYLPLGDYSVLEIESTILPLDWAVEVQ